MNRWFPITTRRLHLRELVAADELGIHAYASDPQVSRYDVWGPNDAAASRTYLDTCLTEQVPWPRAQMTLAIELLAEPGLIGTIRLTIKDAPNKTADMGYSINRKYWGKGYATEAAGVVVDAAFRHMGLHRVWAVCDTRNHASYRVMEKLGMRREALYRRDVLQKGEWRDTYLYAVLAQER